MRNQPQHDWNRHTAESASAWDLDTAPGQRLLALFVVILLPIVAVGWRLAVLQTERQPAYLEPFEQTRQVFEPIPAREGRILAADGTVLADDVPSYDLLVHYRWLEQPIDRRWLRRKAWEQLSRSERRNAAAVASAEQQVLARRERLWDDLRQLVGATADDTEVAAREIQIRVERIWETVNQRRLANLQSVPETPAPAVKVHWALRWWQGIAEELSQPPRRRSDEPLVIVEQEDYHVVWSDVSAEVAAAIESHPERYPGVKTQVRTRRVYPHRDLAVHLLGARTPLREEEADRAAGPQPGEMVGRSGLERQYDSVLHGHPGRLRRVIDRHGEVVTTEIVEPARHGQDLVLTLDLALQRRAEQLLDVILEAGPRSGDDVSPESVGPSTPPTGGCLVAIEVQTGAILAAAAAPRFDANLLVSADRATWNRLAADPRKPFYPRLTHMAVPPGSVFKAVSAVALLQSGTLHPEDTVPCIGYLDSPTQHRCLVYRHYGVGHGDTSLSDALCRSCNVYFFHGARRAGPQPLVDWSRRLGFGQPTGVDLPSEAAGTLPSPDQPGTSGPRRWYAGDTLGLAIGQSSLTTTPLQIARMMAAIANGGFLVTPHLATTGGPTSLEVSVDLQAQPVFAHPEPESIPELRGETLAAIREGLYRVVHDPAGTAYKTVRLREVTIAGKTGTAEVGGGQSDHAWFAGYTPAENPRVAFAVVIEHGGSGSRSAGPVAREFVRSLLDLGLITPTSTVAER